MAWIQFVSVRFVDGRTCDDVLFSDERKASMRPMSSNPKWAKMNDPTATMKKPKP
jgi:hypothetical protein